MRRGPRSLMFSAVRGFRDPQGEYVLSLKENQPNLYEDCGELFAWLKGPHPLDEEIVLPDFDTC